MEIKVTNYWNAEGAAERLGVTVFHVYCLAALGRLEVRRRGRRCLFEQNSIDAYLASRRKASAAEHTEHEQQVRVP